MKKYISIIISLFFVGSCVFAQSGGLNVIQGGTGLTAFQAGSILIGGSQLRLATTSISSILSNINTNPFTASYFVSTSTATSTFSGGIESGTKIAAPYFIATSTAATSTFNGGLTVGNNAALTVNQAAAANSLYITPSGAIGFGTANPAVKFVMVPSSTDGDGLNITNSSNTVDVFSMSNFDSLGGSFQMTDYLGNVTAKIRGYSYLGAQAYFMAGNVGIGTTSPYAPLSVVGDVVARDFIATSTTDTSNFAGNLTVTGKTTLGYASTTQLSTNLLYLTGSTYNVSLNATSTQTEDTPYYMPKDKGLPGQMLTNINGTQLGWKNPDIQGLVTYYDTNWSSDVGGAYTENTLQATTSKQTFVTTLGAGNTLMTTYITPVGTPGLTTIPAGQWVYHTQALINSASATTRLYAEIYKRSAGGTETLLMTTTLGNTLTLIAEGYDLTVATSTITLLATDRLEVKLYANTNTAGSAVAQDIMGTTQSGLRLPVLFQPGFGLPGGINTQVQFNDYGVFGGSSNFTFDKTTNLLNIQGDISVGSNGLLLSSTGTTTIPKLQANTLEIPVIGYTYTAFNAPSLNATSTFATSLFSGNLTVTGKTTLGYASTTQLSATKLYGALTGNADTSTALASNPTNCSSGNFPLGIDASGNVESCTTAYTAAGTHTGLIQSTAAGTSYITGGNVGIGTTGPGIGDLQYAAPLTISSATQLGTFLAIKNTDATYGMGGVWMQTNATNAGWLFGTQNDGKAVFHYGSGASETAALTAAKDGVTGLTIDTTGNVGIGTTSPGFPLDIYSSGAQPLTIRTTGASGPLLTFYVNSLGKGYIGMDGGALTAGASQEDLTIRTDGTSGQMRFNIGGTTKMIMDNSGNVGIGVTAPDYKLDVAGTARINMVAGNYGTTMIDNFGSGTAARLIQFNGSGTITNVFDSNGSSFINGGNVGIGTTTPGSLLEISSSASGAVGPTATLHNTGATALGNAADIAFALDTGATALSPNARIRTLMDGAAGRAAITFQTYNGSATAERVRIQNDGNVGIGSTTPTSLLSIGTANASTTVTMGKIQWEGQNSAGATVCMFVAGTSIVVQSGACNK